MGSVDVMHDSAHVAMPEVPYVLSEKVDITGIESVVLPPRATLPDGFPTSVHCPQTWTATDLRGSDDSVLQLSHDEACLIEEAVKSFIDAKLPLPQLNRDSFKLPQTLSEKLDRVSAMCYESRGFCVLRGLEVRQRSEEESAILFAGVSSHVASSRGVQDVERKHVLAHLFKKHRKEANQYIPPSFNDAPVAFHTDDGDIIALYYASLKQQGGRTQLASQTQVYNELAVRRPDLLKVLADDWYVDMYHNDKDTPARRLPLLFHQGDDGITIQYSRLPFSCYDGSRPKRADIPPLTATQIEALNYLQLLSNKHAYAVPTKPGDILYFNNVSLFHARERYEDTATAEMAPQQHDRHLLRLWLLDPKRTTPLAPGMQKIWDDVFTKDREEEWCVKAVDAFAMNFHKNG